MAKSFQGKGLHFVMCDESKQAADMAGMKLTDLGVVSPPNWGWGQGCEASARFTVHIKSFRIDLLKPDSSNQLIPSGDRVWH